MKPFTHALLLRIDSNLSFFFFFTYAFLKKISWSLFLLFNFLFSDLCFILQNVKQIKCMNFWCAPEKETDNIHPLLFWNLVFF